MIPKTLSVNAAKDSTDLVAKLRSCHNAAQKANAGDPKKAYLRYGLDLLNGQIRDNVTAGVLEPTMSKIRSLKSAFEAAVSLLRIDDAIQCLPGTPCPPILQITGSTFSTQNPNQRPMSMVIERLRHRFWSYRISYNSSNASRFVIPHRVMWATDALAPKRQHHPQLPLTPSTNDRQSSHIHPSCCVEGICRRVTPSSIIHAQGSLRLLAKIIYAPAAGRGRIVHPTHHLTTSGRLLHQHNLDVP